MFVIVAPNHLARGLQFDSTCMRVYQSCISPADMFELTNTSVVAGLNQQVCILPNQRTGKHSCTRPAGMHVTLATEQQPCLYKLHTISIHVCYSFILISESMYICTRPSAMSVTIASDHLPCLSQLHCLLNWRLQAWGLKHLHRTRILICYSNVLELQNTDIYNIH